MRTILTIIAVSFILSSCQIKGKVRTIFNPNTEWDCKGSATHTQESKMGLFNTHGALIFSFKYSSKLYTFS